MIKKYQHPAGSLSLRDPLQLAKDTRTALDLASTSILWGLGKAADATIDLGLNTIPVVRSLPTKNKLQLKEAYNRFMGYLSPTGYVTDLVTRGGLNPNRGLETLAGLGPTAVLAAGIADAAISHRVPALPKMRVKYVMGEPITSDILIGGHSITPEALLEAYLNGKRYRHPTNPNIYAVEVQTKKGPVRINGAAFEDAVGKNLEQVPTDNPTLDNALSRTRKLGLNFDETSWFARRRKLGFSPTPQDVATYEAHIPEYANIAERLINQGVLKREYFDRRSGQSVWSAMIDKVVHLGVDPEEFVVALSQNFRNSGLHYDPSKSWFTGQRKDLGNMIVHGTPHEPHVWSSNQRSLAERYAAGEHTPNPWGKENGMVIEGLRTTKPKVTKATGRSSNHWDSKGALRNAVDELTQKGPVLIEDIRDDAMGRKADFLIIPKDFMMKSIRGNTGEFSPKPGIYTQNQKLIPKQDVILRT